MSTTPQPRKTFRHRLHEIVFEAETPAGKAFDIALLLLIVLSIVVVMIESSRSYALRYGASLLAIEWILTILFTIEYLLRLYSSGNPRRYATSFFGIIDLIAILPTYLSLIFVGTRYLLIVRALRLLRIFRIFKMGHFLNEGYVLMRAMRASRPKIIVFLTFIVIMTMILGSVMYLLEGGVNDDFSSIPRGVYWAVVTLTTVGYGDITPVTNLGQFFSAIVMILGYAIIAVPTGIVTNELIRAKRPEQISTEACPHCSREGHDADAVHCKYCGWKLNP